VSPDGDVTFGRRESRRRYENPQGLTAHEGPSPSARITFCSNPSQFCPVTKLRSFGKIIGIEEHFPSLAVRAPWATSASAGQDASESLHLGDIQDRLEELSDERLARMDDDIKKFLHAYSPMRSAGWELLRP